MSTKCSIAYGENFHFYEECFDRSNVYLEIEKTEFKVTSNSVMVQIPINVWREMFKTWSQKGWSEEQDNKELIISSEWLESLEELVKIKEKDKKTNESQS